MPARLLSAAVCLCLAVPLLAAEPPQQEPIPGLGPIGPVTKVQTGFVFTEGPAVNATGELFFSDTRDEKIYKIGTDGQLSVYVTPTHKGNGLFVRANGDVVACEMDSGRLSTIRNGKAEPLVEQYEGKRFNAPNDLVIDRDGGVYFTDPTFNAPKPAPQDKTCVYYLPLGASGATRVIDDLTNPNGVLLSPDEKTLYVFPSGTPDMMAYPIESPGKVGKGRVFCSLKQAEGKTNGGGDGCEIDAKGNVYIASALGLQVFDPGGKLLGIIAFPEQPSNAAFGGRDHKTLYVTARTSVYSVPMEVAGHIFPAGKK
jgi:gluconolactonase